MQYYGKIIECINTLVHHFIPIIQFDAKKKNYFK